VGYSTHDGTAEAGSDYEATEGTLTIPAGETSGVITVDVLSDKVRELNEKLTVTLATPAFGTLADGTATGTILNDDTLVQLGLRNAVGDHVRATVNTAPDAPGAEVKVFQVTKSGKVLLLTANLNDLGRVSRVLDREFKAGASPTFVAKVVTENGAYASVRKSIVVD
jgi:hypothetical protein